MNNLTVDSAGSALLGAGLTQVTVNVKLSLLLIGVAVVMKVLVAVLNKEGIAVQSNLG